MRITKRELTELLLHLDANHLTWSQSMDNPALWLNMIDEYGLLLTPYSGVTAEASLVPADLPGERLRDLLLRYTSFGTRLAMEELLRKEAPSISDHAAAFGIALSMVEPVGPSIPAVAPAAERAATFQIREGGFVHLSLSKTDVLQVILSLPARGEMIFPCAFTGLLRAVDGRTRDNVVTVIEGALDESVPPSGLAQEVP